MKTAFFSLREYDELPFCEEYSRKYNIDYTYTPQYPNEENLSIAQGCDAISITPCEITEKFIKKLASYNIKYIICRSIGYDHIPFEWTKRNGIKVCAVSYPPDCVANYAIMLMLMASRQVKEIMLRNEAQDFSLKGKMGKDISDLTIGVIGTGNIGATVIKHLSGFGCKILAYNIFEVEELKQYAKFVTLDELYKNSDIITLHLASNPQTYHIINDEAFNKMKDGVIIVNTARGTLIDSKALIKNIKSGKVSSAGLDVIENENDICYHNQSGKVMDNDEMAILKSFPNVIYTAHMAFYTKTTVSNMIEKSFKAVKYYERGEANPYEVCM